MELVKKYFPDINETQSKQYEALWDLYQDWNSKINVISRKDIDNLYINHVLHSLSIARFINFVPDTEILDLGTGGGFPGIPLAILFPQVKFTLIDGTRKKITVCNEVIHAIGLKNVVAKQQRAEESKERFDFVVTRAVARADKLMGWSRRLIHNKHKNSHPNGLIALKGGNIREELSELPSWEYHETVPLQKYFPEEAFAEKCLIYIQS